MRPAVGLFAFVHKKIFTGAGYMVDSNKEHLAYEKTNQEERKEQPT